MNITTVAVLTDNLDFAILCGGDCGAMGLEAYPDADQLTNLELLRLVATESGWLNEDTWAVTCDACGDPILTITRHNI